MNQPVLKNQFLRRLKAHIDADKDLNVSKLAVDADLSNSAIRLMFSRNAESVRLSTADAICKALGTTYEEFMSEAVTSDEKEIVRLTMLLPDHLRQKLLGYGERLLDEVDQDQPESGEDG